MRYLVDSDYLIDATGGNPSAIQTLQRLSDEGVAISIISYGEIFEGAYGFPDPTSMLAAYQEFLSDYPTLPLSEPIMATFARIRAHLRRAGQLIPDLDLLIAATALAHDLTLVTRNIRHFARVSELAVFRVRE